MLAELALTGRIGLLGYERIVFAQAGRDKDTLSTTFFLFSFAALFQLPLLFFTSWTWIDLIRGSLSGLIYTLTFTLYIYALSHFDVSLMTPLYNFNVFFLLLLSVLFLDETFGWLKIVGLALLIYGLTFLNRQTSLWQSIRAVITHRGCQLMMIVSMFMAVGRVIDRLMIRNSPPLVYSFAIYLFMGIYLFMILLIQRKIPNLRGILRDRPGPILIGGLLNAYSYLLLLLAIQTMEVSVAEPLSMLSGIITILLARVVFHEEIKTRFWGALIMIGGAILVAIPSSI